MRTAIHALGRRQAVAEKGISKLEDISFEASKAENTKQNKIEQNIQQLLDNYNKRNIHVLGGKHSKKE